MVRSFSAVFFVFTKEHAMSAESDTIIINMYGGIAGALVDQAFAQLSAFKELKACSTLYSRCVASHTSPKDTLFHLLSNAPITGRVCDAAQQSTIFKEMKQLGYKTEFRGPFGLKSELRVEPDCTDSLQHDWGIDDFDEQDGAFCSCVCDEAHDEFVFSRGLKSISKWEAADKHALMLNVYGCRSIGSLTLKTESSTRQHIQNCAPYPLCDGMHKYLSKSVTDDSMSDPSARARNIPYCIADYNHRQTTKKLPDGDIDAIEMSLLAHATAWCRLRKVNEQLSRLILHLKHKGTFHTTSIVLLSAKGMSLFEHGAVDSMPWESSLRCFALFHRAGQSHSEVQTDPVPSSVFGSLILNTCGLTNVQWKTECNLPSISKCIVSLQLDACHLSLHADILGYDIFTFPAFCIRCKIFHDRWYCISAWFSVDQLLPECSIPKFDYLRVNQEFKNPVIPQNSDSLLMQVYDHMTDTEEVIDLYTDRHWRRSSNGNAILLKYFSEVQSHVGDSLIIDFSHIPGLQPRYAGMHALLLGVCNTEQVSRIESKLSDVSGDITIVLSRDLVEILLPGVFHDAWRGELKMGENTVSIYGDGTVTINNHLVVTQKYHFRDEARQLCVCLVRTSKPKTPQPSGSKGRIHKVQRRGNR